MIYVLLYGKYVVLLRFYPLWSHDETEITSSYVIILIRNYEVKNIKLQNEW